MSEIQIVGSIKIHPGKLEAFQDLARTCSRIVREQDTGTLQYDWFLNAERGDCVVIERYRSLETWFEHMEHLGDAMQTMFAMGEVSGSILAEPSEALSSVAAQFGLPLYAPMPQR